MICIVNDGRIVLLSDKIFKEFEELLAIPLPSVGFPQPDFVKLNNVACLSTTELSQYFSIFLISKISCSMLIGASLMPDRMSYYLIVLSPAKKERRILNQNPRPAVSSSSMNPNVPCHSLSCASFL